ncbi:glyoxalase [candidate division WOR_3 bacterium SM23_60]|uniref:Glyoxalase n=1 Tax=candidate division WOR_3 bacterium SM23_60 TaxID=1703780 RepID=A0A0S8GK76_UNCW3|nr:MAG: glyoxalase [candidate division WOR_3 bacterium SM23_60]
MPRVIHFEIHADDPGRAAKFYQEVFGWKIEKWQGPMDYWLVYTGENEPGIDGAIAKREQPLRGGDGVVAYVCTVGVKQIDSYIEKVKAHGGEIIIPKRPVPGVGWFAQCNDTEGNLFGLMEDDPEAK